MSAGEQSTATSPLTREQVLDELEFLAKVEHALVIECLSVCYALGYDLGPDEGGPTTGPGSEAAGAAMSLARNTEMFHLEDLNLALIHASRPPQMDWAASISGAPGSDIPLGPPDLGQLQQLVAREQAIATAVDARYARLAPAVTSDPVFDGYLLNELQPVIVDHGTADVASRPSRIRLLTAGGPGLMCRSGRLESSTNGTSTQARLRSSDQALWRFVRA